MIPNANITDAERAEFLRKLDGSDLMFSTWEQNFLLNFVADTRFFWTDGRRVAVDKMRMLYGSEVKMPFPLAATRRPATPAADKDCCMFLKRDDERRLRPCNDPGALVNRHGFIYCLTCGEQVQRDLRRRGGHMELRTYLPKKS